MSQMFTIAWAMPGVGMEMGWLTELSLEKLVPCGELMEKALRYLNVFWIQLFAYTHDGSYTIDNSITERFIRPLAGERKNSLFFRSGKMTRVSAAYHTIISTCKMQGTCTALSEGIL